MPPIWTLPTPGVLPTTVTLRQGLVRGAERDGVLSFKGIPYAAAPFGLHRFAAPAPPPTWDGVRDALTYGPTAPKPPYPGPIAALLPDPVVSGEECLNLNIWTTDLDAGAPVLVWVHGGAFVNGSGAVPQYDGTAFARDGVVCVTINYRLGVDGFAYIDGAPANRGLLDQVAALQWVRDNIAAFGGDPGQVTIAGESAGAMSVTTLLSMPSAQGLFSRVIAQSGAGHHALRPATAARVSAALASRLGVQPTVAGFGGVALRDLLEAQAALSAQITLDQDLVRWGELARNAMAFEPVIDGVVLPALPIEAIESGAGSQISVLTGTNTDEHALFLVPLGVVAFIDDARVLATLARLGADAEPALASYRLLLPDASPGQLLIAILTDWFFRLPAIRLVEARQTHGAGSYVYEFGWRSSAYADALGACHALEIPFTFDTLSGSDALTGANAPQPLAEAMHAAWVRFVRTGDPGWPMYGAARCVQYFGDEISTVLDPAAARRELWAGVR